MTETLGPVVAGRFYPKDRDSLVEQIESCFTHELGPGELPSVANGKNGKDIGLVAPHAGYSFSGPVAAHAYKFVAQAGSPSAVVVIGTNHSGVGADSAVLCEGGWSTPLGTVSFDEELAGRLLEASRKLRVDRAPFRREHSLEVQLPFLQYLYGSDFSFVPVCLKDQSREVAKDLAEALQQVTPDGTLVVASTDFSHYETQRVAENKDRRAMESILAGDVDGLYEEVFHHQISICGYGTLAALLGFAKRKGLCPSELKYATSGDVTNRGDEVVGYCAIGFQ